MSFGIILPPGVDLGPRVTYECTTCGSTFGEKQRMAYERHVIRCADVNEDVIAQEYADAQKNAYEVKSEDEKGEYLELREKAMRDKGFI